MSLFTNDISNHLNELFYLFPETVVSDADGKYIILNGGATLRPMDYDGDFIEPHTPENPVDRWIVRLKHADFTIYCPSHINYPHIYSDVSPAKAAIYLLKNDYISQSHLLRSLEFASKLKRLDGRLKPLLDAMRIYGESFTHMLVKHREFIKENDMTAKGWPVLFKVKYGVEHDPNLLAIL